MNIKGKNNHNYIDGRSKQICFCKDCHKQIKWQTEYYGYKRCQSCWSKNRLKNPKLNPRYIDGRTVKQHKCIQCHKIISDYKSTRCKKCSYEFYSGNKHWRYRDIPKVYCKTCGKLLHRRAYITKATKCNKCKNKNRKHTLVHNLKISNTMKRTLIKHHVYLRYNSDKTILINISTHSKLHTKCYEYLVNTNQIEKYFKWFKKNYKLRIYKEQIK
jgi:hypothetical protein